MKEEMKESAFRSIDVARLLGISLRQLDYWARTGLIEPSILDAAGRGSTRIFNFSNLIQIRTVKALIEGGMTLQKIRKSVNYLRTKLNVSLPLTARLLTDGETIFQLVKSDKELILAIDTLKHQGQGCFFIPIGKLKQEVEEKVRKLRKVA